MSVDWKNFMVKGAFTDTDEMLLSLNKVPKELVKEEVVRDRLWVFHNEEDWMDFMFAESHSETPGEVWLKPLLFGCGPRSVLRECRHTWWGELDNSGYIFYPNADHIIAAMNWLKKHYDMN